MFHGQNQTKSNANHPTIEKKKIKQKEKINVLQDNSIKHSHRKKDNNDKGASSHTGCLF